MKEDEVFGETELRDLTSEPYTIKVKYHDGASKLERHGAMWDMAASETVALKEGEVRIIPLGVSMQLPSGYMGVLVPRSSTCLKHGIMMANSVGIIENDYCGDNDVWGFVAYAVRDTAITKGTRIAQFMPVPMFGDLDFDVVESMPCTDRGGYGSTGERSNGGEPSFYDRRGRKLTVGCYCRINGTDSIGIVKKLYENKERGPIVLADFTGYGEMRKRCVEVELDERPRDCDGVPIEVGEVVYYFDKESGEPKAGFGPFRVIDYDPHAQAVLLRYEKGGVDGYGNYSEGFELCELLTHREPDSWEKLEDDSLLSVDEYRNLTGIDCNEGAYFAKQRDLIRRAKRLAGVNDD